MSQVKSYFERYPNSNEVFENGGKLFHERGAADSYGQSETTRYTRQQVEKEEEAATELKSEVSETTASDESSNPETKSEVPETNAEKATTQKTTSKTSTK